MDNEKIYAIDYWRDPYGFDGTYAGPFLSWGDAVTAARGLCEQHGLTFNELGYSAEMLEDGSEPMLKICSLALPWPFAHIVMPYVRALGGAS